MLNLYYVPNHLLQWRQISHQETNGGFTRSMCLKWITFLKKVPHKGLGKITQKRRFVFITLLIWFYLLIPSIEMFHQKSTKWLGPNRYLGGRYTHLEKAYPWTGNRLHLYIVLPLCNTWSLNNRSPKPTFHVVINCLWWLKCCRRWPPFCRLKKYKKQLLCKYISLLS